MPKKSRPKLVKPYKGKKVSVMNKGGNYKSEPKGRNAKAEVVLDQEKAAYELSNRPTKDFSTEELGALMQVPPGGAETYQVKKQSRQFNRVADQMPEAMVADKRVSPGEDLRYKKPMSAKTPKIDPED
jgi:hypothetical protein